MGGGRPPIRTSAGGRLVSSEGVAQIPVGTGLAAVAERERKTATGFGLSSGRCGSQLVPVETAN